MYDIYVVKVTVSFTNAAQLSLGTLTLWVPQLLWQQREKKKERKKALAKAFPAHVYRQWNKPSFLLPFLFVFYKITSKRRSKWPWKGSWTLGNVTLGCYLPLERRREGDGWKSFKHFMFFCTYVMVQWTRWEFLASDESLILTYASDLWFVGVEVPELQILPDVSEC